MKAIIIITISIILILIYIVATEKDYVASKYGNKCYGVGYEHRNIDYPIKFKTIDECLNYLRK